MDRRLIFDEPRRGSVDSPSMKCVEAKLQWKTFRDSDSDQWIAVCEPMGLAVHAETYAELATVINETLLLVFKDLHRMLDGAPVSHRQEDNEEAFAC